MQTFSQILLPVDGSMLGRASVATACSVAQLHSAEVTVLSCVDLQTITASALEMSPHEFMGLWNEATEKLNNHLDEILKELRDAGVVARSQIVAGRPVEQILAAATDHDADLIVIASRGRSGFRNWLRKSVTEGVLRGAKRPVLIVPREYDS